MKQGILSGLVGFGVLALSNGAFAQAIIEAAPMPPAESHEDVPDVILPSTMALFDHGEYVAADMGVTNITGEVAPTFGLRGALRLNRRFGVGLSGTGVALNDFRPLDERMSVGYGGVFGEYIVGSNRLLHGVVDLTLGGGAVCHDGGTHDCNGHAQGFFLAEPTANLELNIASFLRLETGVGYRFAVARERDGIGTADLSGFVGRVGLAFGRF